jgi:hypothetical protein
VASVAVMSIATEAVLWSPRRPVRGYAYRNLDI